MGNKLSPNHLSILLHSLGLDEYGRGNAYRDYYCAGGSDVAECRELVGRGYMVEFASVGGALFRVTQSGERAARDQSPEPPRLTRSQRRYQQWLRIADVYGGTFGDWLREGEANE